MNKDDFRQNLLKATDAVVPFSQKYLINPLPPSCRYLIFPNQSYDRHPLERDEQLFPNDSMPPYLYIGPYDEELVVKYLWRNRKIPEWINVSVYSYDAEYTYLELICCGRFTATKVLLYHKGEGYPPFHILSPNLPPKWESIEQNGRFDLYWGGERVIITS